MPSWKKIIISGSDAALKTVTANSFTGSLLGTASYATQALSASWAPGGASFPYTGSAEITGSLNVAGTLRTTGSIIVQNGAIGVVSTGTSNASEAFKVQNSTPDNLLTIKDDGELSVNTTRYNLNGILENNNGIIQEIQGWSGNININTTPPISITVQNGIITNVI